MTMFPRRSVIAAVIAALVALAALAAGPVAAQTSLEDAKAAGLVGERPDGLVGVVAAGAAPDVLALVDDVNRQRMVRYAELAAGNNSTVEAVQTVAGAQLIERTLAGQFVMNAAGRWIKK